MIFSLSFGLGLLLIMVDAYYAKDVFGIAGMKNRAEGLLSRIRGNTPRLGKFLHWLNLFTLPFKFHIFTIWFHPGFGVICFRGIHEPHLNKKGWAILTLGSLWAGAFWAAFHYGVGLGASRIWQYLKQQF